jgi:hypothetical protein
MKVGHPVLLGVVWVDADLHAPNRMESRHPYLPNLGQQKTYVNQKPGFLLYQDS